MPKVRPVKKHRNYIQEFIDSAIKHITNVSVFYKFVIIN